MYLHYLKVGTMAILGHDGPIALIPTPSYFFHHSETMSGKVPWLPRAELVTSAFTNWKRAQWGSLSMIIWMLQLQCCPTPFITLIPSQARSCNTELIALAWTNWKQLPGLSFALMVLIASIPTQSYFFQHSDSLITPIPMPSYSFHLSDTNWGKVTWL